MKELPPIFWAMQQHPFPEPKDNMHLIHSTTPRGES